MKNNFAFLFVAGILLMGSCATPKVAYLTEMNSGRVEKVSYPLDIKVRPTDKISILVNSKDPLLMNLFNLPVLSRQIGTTGSYTGYGVSGYTVNQSGDIDFPVLGAIHVEGMTRDEIALYIKRQLISNNLVKDPVVTVEFMNLTISVLGEVAKPGRYDIDRDRLTLLDALGMAGDLTIYGKRDNVLLQREENGNKVIYRVDLNSGLDLYASPAFYLQQNDIIYVEPNDVRARQATVNGNNIRSTSFWISIASLLTSITMLIIK